MYSSIYQGLGQSYLNSTNADHWNRVDDSSKDLYTLVHDMIHITIKWGNWVVIY